MVIFSFLSSSIYIFNDIADREADRNHPTKRNRPIASGKVPVKVAAITALLLIQALSYPLIFSPCLWPHLYCLPHSHQSLYSKWLKHIPLIDVMILASGYVLRVAAGVTLIVVERFSPWLYVVTTLFALLLDLVTPY